VARRPVHSEDRSAAPDGGENKADRGHQFRLAGILVLGILLGWFALANIRTVRIDFWVVDGQAPLILVIVISGLLGALITGLVLRRKAKAEE
jgi:uncharacterized integral membrane protein